MEESLKSIRTVFRILISVVLAVFLFALSPDLKAEYEAALGFLERLESFPSEDYRDWAEQLASQNLLRRNDFLREVVAEVAARGGPTID